MTGARVPGAGMPDVRMSGAGMPGVGMPGVGMPGLGMPGLGMPGLGMLDAEMPGAGAAIGPPSCALGSALYVGAVTHRRTRPKAHHLRYRVFSLLLDIDAIPALCGRLRLMSHGRFNLFGFDERDHADGTGGSLRLWAESHLARAGIDLQGGNIFLLAMPRVLGFGFNPISVWYCHFRDGRLAALLYEVHNTFGERHTYLIPADADGVGRDVAQTCAKQFHVSPFMPMEMTYRFRVHVPEQRLSLAIQATSASGHAIDTVFAARRRALTDTALLKVFMTLPLLTMKVVAGIHWEALRLWWKGLVVFPHPAPPPRAVTIPNKPVQ